MARMKMPRRPRGSSLDETARYLAERVSNIGEANLKWGTRWSSADLMAVQNMIKELGRLKEQGLVPMGLAFDPNAKDITPTWIELIKELFYTQENVLYAGAAGRKYVSDRKLIIPGEEWERGFSIPLEDLGYSASTSSTKFQQLTRNYFDPEVADAMRVKLEERIRKNNDFTSIAMHMAAGDKRKDSQGHCMQSLVVTYIPAWASFTGDSYLGVTVFYRITEVIKKFGADLHYLSEFVLPRILPDNSPVYWTEVKLDFANVFISCMYLPLLYPYIDPADLLEELANLAKDGDRYKGENSFAMATRRYITWPILCPDPMYYNYRSRQEMHRRAIAMDEAGYVDHERIAYFVEEKDIIKINDNVSLPYAAFVDEDVDLVEGGEEIEDLQELPGGDERDPEGLEGDGDSCSSEDGSEPACEG